LSEFFPKNNFYSKIPLRIFGCVTYVHIHKHQRDKLDARALKCVFIGYYITQKGYKCYHPSSKRFVVSKDVSFNENQSFFNKSSLQGEENNTEDKTNNDFDIFHSKSHLGSNHLAFHHPMSLQILLCREKLLLTDLFRYIEEGYRLI
jgi:hypothetical protein